MPRNSNASPSAVPGVETPSSRADHTVLTPSHPHTHSEHITLSLSLSGWNVGAVFWPRLSAGAAEGLAAICIARGLAGALHEARCAERFILLTRQWRLAKTEPAKYHRVAQHSAGPGEQLQTTI